MLIISIPSRLTYPTSLSRPENHLGLCVLDGVKQAKREICLRQEDGVGRDTPKTLSGMAPGILLGTSKCFHWQRVFLMSDAKFNLSLSQT